MNIYEKLQNMRVELQQKNIKKSGKNKFAGYDYYELADILPPINELQAKYKTCSFIKFNKDEAVLTITNSETPDEKIEFTSPMAELTLKGTHPIQNLGGIETYQRRYLYMAAWEIVENDYFDCVQGKSQSPQAKQAKPVLPKELQEQLNSQITKYAELSNRAIADISKELIETVKKPLKTVNEGEAKMLLTYLQGKINKESN